MSPESLAAAFRAQPVTVLGDAMYDLYRDGVILGPSRQEGPASWHIRETKRNPTLGGAANVVNNLASLGSLYVRLITVVGADNEGTWLRTMLGRPPIVTDAVFQDPNYVTIVKDRIMVRNFQHVQVDHAPSGPPSENICDDIVELLEDLFAQPRGCLIISDYDYGLVTPRIRAVLEEHCRTFNSTVVVDARSPRHYINLECTLLKVNYDELLKLLRIHTDDAPEGSSRVDFVANQSDTILNATKALHIAVTLDSLGVTVIDRHGSATTHIPSAATALRSSIGAGDTFTATMALSMAAGLAAVDAATVANLAAAIVVEKEGTAPVELKKLQARLRC